MNILFATAVVLVSSVAVNAQTDANSQGFVELGKSVRYNFGGADYKAFKPYVVKVCSPKGINPLRDNVFDHIHHHALMYAVAIDDVDFWAEVKNCGKQLQRSITSSESAIESQLDWVKADEKTVVAVESRTIALHKADPSYTLISWRTRLAPPAGAQSIKLTGGHYYGLGMRFVTSMDKAGEFAWADPNAKSTPIRSDEKLTPSAWVACTGNVDGNTVTTAMFDHPENPRPALWFTMSRPFSYQSATINLWKEPMVIKAGEEMDVCYGVAVWDGKPSREQIDAACRQWSKLAPSPKKTGK